MLFKDAKPSRMLRHRRLQAAAAAGFAAAGVGASLAPRPTPAARAGGAGSCAFCAGSGSASASANNSGDPSASLVERVAAAARARGLDIAVGLTLQDYNRMLERDGHPQLALPTFGRTQTLAVLLGSTKRIWVPFTAALASATQATALFPCGFWVFFLTGRVWSQRDGSLSLEGDAEHDGRSSTSTPVFFEASDPERVL